MQLPIIFNYFIFSIASGIQSTLLSTNQPVTSMLIDPFNPYLLIFTTASTVQVFNMKTEKIILRVGSTRPGFSDGQKDYAKFRDISGVCVYINESLIIADTGNHCFRTIVREYAEAKGYSGHCGKAGHADGHYNKATFTRPRQAVVDYIEGFIYTIEEKSVRRLDIFNYTVKKLDYDFSSRRPLSIAIDFPPANLYIATDDGLTSLETKNLSATEYQIENLNLISKNSLTVIDNATFLATIEEIGQINVIDLKSSKAAPLCTIYAEGGGTSCLFTNLKGIFFLPRQLTLFFFADLSVWRIPLTGKLYTYNL